MTQIVLGMTETLERQRSAFIAGGRPSTKLRRDRLQRAISMLLQNQDTIVEAVRSDFGHRAPLETKAAEILTPVGFLGNAAAHLDQWKQPETRTLAPERQAGSRGGRAQSCVP